MAETFFFFFIWWKKNVRKKTKDKISCLVYKMLVLSVCSLKNTLEISTLFIYLLFSFFKRRRNLLEFIISKICYQDRYRAILRVTHTRLISIECFPLFFSQTCSPLITLNIEKKIWVVFCFPIKYKTELVWWLKQLRTSHW